MEKAFIFPAFISEYIGTEIQILNTLSGNFHQNLSIASNITGDDFSAFSISNTAFTEDELRSQLISYVFSCSLADALIDHGLKPDILAGYSMGIYAASYTGGVISFVEGVKLIKQAFLISKSVIGDTEYGMGSIIGLTYDETQSVINKYKLIAEIANTNSVHAHLITGTKEAVVGLLEKAKEIGALNTSMLNVSTPYHSKILKATKEEFQQFISDHINLQQSKYPLISSINQSLLSSIDDINIELSNNLFKRINWMATFNKLVNMGIQQFIECGAGKSLKNISRFIPGEFTVYPINKIDKLI